MATNFDRIGSEIQVNETILNGQTDPDVAVATDGRFLVAFDESFTDSGSDHDIYLQFVNANGTRSGSEVHVRHQRWGSVRAGGRLAAGGGAAVVWHDDAAGNSIRLQVVNSDGSLSGSALTVSDATLAPLRPFRMPPCWQTGKWSSLSRVTSLSTSTISSSGFSTPTERRAWTDQDLSRAIAVYPLTGQAFIAWQDSHAFLGERRRHLSHPISVGTLSR